MARAEIKPGGGGSPAPDPNFTGKGGAPGAEVDEVVTGAEGTPLPFDEDDVDFVVGLGPLDRGADLARHARIDRVEAIGAVQAQARDPPLFDIVGDAQAAEDGHVDFSWRLDSSQLPSPMQIGLTLQADWALGVERLLRLE